MDDITLNNWPPAGFDPNLPADFQGIHDPGNDDGDDEIELLDNEERI